MSGYSQQLINGLNNVHKNQLSNFSSGLKKALRGYKLRGFTQWHDFSQSDVLHLHIDALEWLGGAQYRKHTYHYFLLYNFATNDTALTATHKKALDGLMEDVIKPFWAASNESTPLRYFEYYQSPYFINLKSSKKDQILGEQFTRHVTSNASRNDLLTENIRDAVVASASSQSWWRKNAISFANTTGSWNPKSNGLRANHVYPCFEINKLLHITPRADISGNFSTIVGGASALGNEPKNQTLSEGRASAVQQYLDSDPLKFGFKTITTSGTGSQQLIVPSPTNQNADENRNAQFVYYQASDYVEIEEKTRITSQYDNALGYIEGVLDNRIAQLEGIIDGHLKNNPVAYVDISDSPKLIPRDKLPKLMRQAETEALVGLGCFHYCVTDTQAIYPPGKVFGIPDFTTLADGKFSFTLDTPENSGEPNVFTGSPLEYMLFTGSPTNKKRFVLPLSAAAKLEDAASLLQDMHQKFNSTYNVSNAVAQYTLFTRYYAEVACFDEVWGYSFGMRKCSKAQMLSQLGNRSYEYYFDSSKLHTITKYNYQYLQPKKTTATITYQHDNLKIHVSSLINNHSPSGYYWYTKDDLDILAEPKNAFCQREYRLLYLSFSAYLATIRDTYGRFEHIVDEDKDFLDFFNQTITITDDELMRCEFLYLK